jgi:hypothetical protein
MHARCPLVQGQACSHPKVCHLRVCMLPRMPAAGQLAAVAGQNASFAAHLPNCSHCTGSEAAPKGMPWHMQSLVRMGPSEGRLLRMRRTPPATTQSRP